MQLIFRGGITQGQMPCPGTEPLISFLCISTGSGNPTIVNPIRARGAGVLPGPYVLDVSTLEVLVSGYFVQGLASSTCNSYASAKGRYLSFCADYNLPPFPLSEHNPLCLQLHWPTQVCIPHQCHCTCQHCVT